MKKETIETFLENLEHQLKELTTQAQFLLEKEKQKQPMNEESLIIRIPQGRRIPEVRRPCFASDASFTYCIRIGRILHQFVHPEDGSTFLEVLAKRSVIGPGELQGKTVARTRASLLPLLSEHLTAFSKIVSSLEEARCDAVMKMAPEQIILRHLFGIDWACRDIQQAQAHMQSVLRDIALPLSSPDVKDLALTLTLLMKCLIDWLELDEGCTCTGSPSWEDLCLTCSSHQAVMQARRWLQLLAFYQSEHA